MNLEEYINSSERSLNCWIRWMHSMGEFVYAVTAAEGIILSSLFIGRKQR